MDNRVYSGSPNSAIVDIQRDPTLHDPIKLLASGEDYTIVDGHRRMTAAFEAGIESIPALVYPEDTPVGDIIHRVLTSAIISRNLSGVEIATLAYKTTLFAQGTPCKETLPLKKIDAKNIPEELLPYFNRLIGRNVSGEFMLRCFHILTLSQEELTLLHRLQIPLENILYLLDLGPKERLMLLKLKEAAPLSTSQTRHLARLLIFARARRGFDIKTWFDTSQKAERTPQKGADIISSLRRELYPDLTNREKNIASLVKSMKLSTSIRINTPENLEGNELSCYFTCSTVEELEHALSLFQKAIKEGSIQSILDELNEP